MQPSPPVDTSPESEQDERFMQRALELARATVALASPNPQVGCVLVRDDEVLGEGIHLYDARDHAEIAALKDAAHRGRPVQGCTAYVTLEPCSHHGRTGPCADALIAAGIARAVVATVDPNPLVSGRGLARLRDAGIAVTLGVCQPPARKLIEPFAHFVRQRTPFVTLKAALSADGKLAPSPAGRRPYQPFWLTGPAARGEVQQLRHAADAILTGIGTVLADDPALTDRTGLPRRRPLLRVVLDTHLRTQVASQLVRTATNDVLILCGTDAPDVRVAELQDLGIEVHRLPNGGGGRLNLHHVLAVLAERNMTSLLLEGGSAINGGFLAQQLVEKAVLFYGEAELGVAALPFAEGVPSPFLFEQTLTRVVRTSFGPDACVAGYLRDPWASVI